MRAVAFSETAIKLPTTEKTVPQVFHIMNMFDIPVGAVREVEENKVEHDYTNWTSDSINLYAKLVENISNYKTIFWAFPCIALLEKMIDKEINGEEKDS